MNKLIRFAPLLLVVVIGAFFVFTLDMRKQNPVDELESVLIGKPFPEFDLYNLSGQSVSEVHFSDGRVRLVNVWASWCPTCRYEHPFLAELSHKGVPITGLNYKDNDQEAIAWLEYFGDIYEQQIVDASGRLGLDLGVYGAPETYIVDGDGVIRFRRVGEVNQLVWERDMKALYLSLGGQLND